LIARAEQIRSGYGCSRSADGIYIALAENRCMVKLWYYDLVDQIGAILHGAGRALEGREDAAWRRMKQLIRKRC
jgi:hypothetical protein